MQTQDRFAAETALFEAMLPDLLKTDAKKWFVAWEGEPKGVFETYDQASDFVARVPWEKDVLVREITDEEIRLPLYFLTT
jgi:hypothetical protein